jgi:arylformamidase
VSSDWIDISTPLHNGMVHWPGDVPFERIETLKLADGGECNLSQMSTSVHTGTHIDAPRHFLDGAAGIETMPIAAGIGRARVIAIRDPKLIRIEELESHRPAKGERLLFKTRNSREFWKTDEFQRRFVHFPPDTAQYLAQCGVQTVGVDCLSVGGFETDGAETHRILLRAGIWIIEGLQLEHVEPGEYELFCLPLKIVGSDGAPARALLRKLIL